MRNVQFEVSKAIQANKILMTYKTKPEVGRKSITVGKYQRAVGPQCYAVIIGGHTCICMSAIEAARYFVEYVGRNDAWNALKGRGRKRNLA